LAGTAVPELRNDQPAHTSRQQGQALAVTNGRAHIGPGLEVLNIVPFLTVTLLSTKKYVVNHTARTLMIPILP